MRTKTLKGQYVVYRSEFAPSVKLKSRYATKMVDSKFYGVINIHSSNPWGAKRPSLQSEIISMTENILKKFCT